ncbi:MAG: hypothetical protein JWM06_1343 [Actinomycetia bacterium]|jgi:hypothetical protein|nr:hypothetical protein [Actinomycetes bacterium]
MSFFEPPPPREPLVVRREPEWLGPPDNVLPYPFPLSLILAREARVAVQLHSGRAYRNGFEFALTLRRREERLGIGGNPFQAWHDVQDTGVIPEEALRLGVEFSDGAKATVFDGYRFFATEERPTGPVLIQRGGSGGMRTWELGFWVWPLPPAGTLAFVAEWPSEQVALTRVEIDANLIREAAAKAEELWPDDNGSPRSGQVSVHRVG